MLVIPVLVTGIHQGTTIANVRMRGMLGPGDEPRDDFVNFERPAVPHGSSDEALDVMSDTSGHIGRGAFAIGIVLSTTLFWLGIRGSEAALPWMAEMLAPRGINAGLVLNVIWLALGALLVGALIALAASRLRQRNRSPWWAVAAVVPLAVLALLNDAIFLVSRSFVLPMLLSWTLLLAAGAVALWVLAECLRSTAND